MHLHLENVHGRRGSVSVRHTSVCDPARHELAYLLDVLERRPQGLRSAAAGRTSAERLWLATHCTLIMQNGIVVGVPRYVELATCRSTQEYD